MQYRSIRYGQALSEAEAVASVGSKGDSFRLRPGRGTQAPCTRPSSSATRALGRTSTPPVLATAEWVHWYGHHPATLRHRDANPCRARSRLGTRPPPPRTITTGNHRHQINQPPQNPGLDSDRKAVAAALRPIYQAPSEEAAWEALETFEASELGQRYPAAVRTFTDSWERFTPFLAFPPMVRRVISPPLRGRYPLHQRDRVAELPAAQGHQEPGSLPLRRGSGQAAESWLSATSRTREPDNGKRSSRKDGPARARPPAD